MVYAKIGLHGINNGVGEHVRRLDEAGIPASTVSLGNAGWIAEVAQRRVASDVPHNMVIRWDRPAGRRDDHPLMDLGWAGASAELFPYVQRARQSAPELDPFKKLYRIQFTNEISTNDHDPSEIGYFLLDMTKRLNAMGEAVAVGGFNAGQPKKEHWRAPGMVALLKYLAEHPENTLALHEGKTSPGADVADPIESFVPHMIGRFQYAFEVADELGLARPRVEITEWAWSYNHLPEPEVAMADLEWLGAYLAQFPEVLCANLWNLEPGDKWGSAPEQLVAMLPQITEWQLQARFEGPTPSPRPEPRPEPSVDYKVVVNLAPQDAGAQERETIYNDPEVVEGRQSVVYSADDAARLVAPGQPGSKVRAWWPERWGKTSDGGPAIVPWLKERGVAQVELVQADGQQPPSGAAVSLPVPYLSQWSPTANLSSGDCGPAAVAMVANYYGHNVTVNEAAGAAGQTDPKSTAVWQLQKALGSYGVAQTYKTGLSLDDIRAALDAGSPVILLVHYGSLPGNQDTYQGGHFFVAVGYGASDQGGYFLVNDPNWWGDRTQEGDHRRIDAADLRRALDEATKDDNPVGAGLICSGQASLPPATGQASFGLHATADPVLAPGELEVFRTARPSLIKVLSNIHPDHARQLKAQHPEATWIIRAYLSFWASGAPRQISPAQFVNDTQGDVERTISALGLAPEETLIELHNEPNLTLEGLGGSWSSGTEFNAWYGDVLQRYRDAIGGALFGFPGLSPGPALAVRQEKYDFLDRCRDAMRASDWIGDHTYWGVNETVQHALGNVAQFLQFLAARGIVAPVYETEASDKSSAGGATKGQRYVQFWQGLRRHAQIGGVTYFVASAQHRDFQREIWVKDGQSVGIAEAVASR